MDIISNDVTNRPVFLLGMPRSGTTWLSQIFKSSEQVKCLLSPNYAYAYKNALYDDNSAENWERVLSACLENPDDFTSQNMLRKKGDIPDIGKKNTITTLAIKDTRFHDLYINTLQTLPNSKIIYITRDPRGALNSWWQSKEFPDDENIQDVFRNGTKRKTEGPGEYWGFEDWQNLTSQYLDLAEKHPDRIYIVQYESLVENCEQETEKLYSFAKIEMTKNVYQFIKQSQSLTVPGDYSVYKPPATASKWKEKFPNNLAQTIEAELKGTNLERFLR